MLEDQVALDEEQTCYEKHGRRRPKHDMVAVALALELS